jgi:hypothetical protein
VVDRSDDARVAVGQLVGDRRCAVVRTIVDDEDLERLGEDRERLEGFVDEALEVGLLVVGREEVRELGDAGRPAHAERSRSPSIRMRDGPPASGTYVTS